MRIEELKFFGNLYAIGMIASTFLSAYVAFRAGFLHKIRFGLLESVACLLAFGAVMACLHILLTRLGSIELLDTLSVATACCLPMGYAIGFHAREKVRKKFVFVRGMIFASGVLSVPSIVPAIAATILLVLPGSPFRNDWPTFLAWLALVLPLLAYAWFTSIESIRKDDKPVEPQQ